MSNATHVRTGTFSPALASAYWMISGTGSKRLTDYLNGVLEEKISSCVHQEDPVFLLLGRGIPRYVDRVERNRTI